MLVVFSIIASFLYLFTIDSDPFSEEKAKYLEVKNFKNCVELVSAAYDYKDHNEAIKYGNECLLYNIKTKAWLYMIIAESYYNLGNAEKAYQFALKADIDNKQYHVLGDQGVNLINNIVNSKGVKVIQDIYGRPPNVN